MTPDVALRLSPKDAAVLQLLAVMGLRAYENNQVDLRTRELLDRVAPEQLESALRILAAWSETE